MGLFKSKAERKMERDLKIRTGLNKIRRQIKVLEKNESGYIKKAKRAHEVGDTGNLSFIKSALKKTMSSRKIMERQMLTLETAIQIKDQAESHAQFAESMGVLSKSIADAFESTDLTKSTANFEKAMSQAESMEQRMEIFLDMSGESLTSMSEGSDDAVSDEELDKLLEIDSPSSDKLDELESEISDELKEIERELEA